jgi:hypothetical protein
MTRAEHLSWAKERALEFADRGDKGQTLASFVSDIGKFEGEPIVGRDTMALMTQDLLQFRTSPADLRNWVVGFN